MAIKDAKKGDRVKVLFGHYANQRGRVKKVDRDGVHVKLKGDKGIIVFGRFELKRIIKRSAK